MGNKFFLIYCLLFSAVFGSLFAEDAPEKGFKITKDTVLNVGISLTPEYESNIKKVSTDTVIERNGEVVGTPQVVSDLILHYSPSLRIKLDDRNKTVGFSALFDYNHYLGLDNKETSKKFSDLDIKSDFLGEFNKDGMVVFDFKNSLSRSATPVGEEISVRHKNLLNSFALGLAFKNIENILYAKIKLGVDINYLEQSKDNSVYKDYNYVSPMANLFGRWKFLPKTMAFISISARYQDYYESMIGSAARSLPINSFLGIMGQLTPHLAAKVSAGYSASIGDYIKHDYNANAELIFKYKETGLVVGYLRNMRPSAYYQYMTTHKAYLTFSQKFAKRFLASLNFSYSYTEFGKSNEFEKRGGYEKNEDGSFAMNKIYEDGSDIVYKVFMPKGNRSEHLILLNPSFSYAILSWLGLKANYELEYKDSDYFMKTITNYNDASDSSKSYTATSTTHYNYIDHRVMLSIVLDY